jgi:hypothetical protein
VQRARVIALMLDGPQLTTAEAGRNVGYCGDGSGIQWVRRFRVAWEELVALSFFCGSEIRFDTTGKLQETMNMREASVDMYKRLPPLMIVKRK